jgi:hypothetical protein
MKTKWKMMTALLGKFEPPPKSKSFLVSIGVLAFAVMLDAQADILIEPVNTDTNVVHSYRWDDMMGMGDLNDTISYSFPLSVNISGQTGTVGLEVHAPTGMAFHISSDIAAQWGSNPYVSFMCQYNGASSLGSLTGNATIEFFNASGATPQVSSYMAIAGGQQLYDGLSLRNFTEDFSFTGVRITQAFSGTGSGNMTALGDTFYVRARGSTDTDSDPGAMLSLVAVPEPATALSLVLGSLVIGGYRRIRKAYGL